jgi:menaquinone-dependent protoporphyrinogen oxidase
MLYFNKEIIMKKTKHPLSKSRSLCLLCILALSIFFIGSKSEAEPRTEDDLIEMSCGENENATYVLIAYDTTHGSTAEVAEYIGNDLCDQGFKVDVRLAYNAVNISSYDAVILGSPVYQFAWMEGIKSFIRKNESALSLMPTAYFMLGASMATDTPKNRESVKKLFMDPVLAEFPEVVPLTLGLFGGAVNNENEYNSLERITVKILGFILRFNKEGAADWRNWDTIDIWTEEFVSELESADSL